MSAPVFIELFNPKRGASQFDATTLFNAESIISIRSGENGQGSALEIEDPRETVICKPVANIPSDILRIIDDKVKDLPSIFRASAMFIPVVEFDKENGIEKFINAGKISMVTEHEEHTDIRVAGSILKIAQSQRQVNDLIDAARKHRFGL